MPSTIARTTKVLPYARDGRHGRTRNTVTRRTGRERVVPSVPSDRVGHSVDEDCVWQWTNLMLTV